MGRFDFSKKVALITGGNRGIGKAIAIAFGEAGATGVAAARNVNLLGEMPDIVETAYFLISDSSKYMTGQVLEVAGGINQSKG